MMKYIETKVHFNEMVTEKEYPIKSKVSMQDVIAYGKRRIYNGSINGFYIVDENQNTIYKQADVKLL